MKINSGGWRGLWNERTGLLTAPLGVEWSGEGDSQFAFSQVSLKKEYVVLLTTVRARQVDLLPHSPYIRFPGVTCLGISFSLSDLVHSEKERGEDFDNVL